MGRLSIGILAAFVSAGLVASVLARADPAAQCAAAKLHAAAVKAKAKLGCASQGALVGAPPAPDCLAKAETKFMRTWARIEAKGGCAIEGDATAVEDRVDEFVADLVEMIPATSTTTTTTTTTCSPTSTLILCGMPGSAGLCHIARCPPGQTCDTVGDSCACSGPPVPCGDLPTSNSGSICRLGECPAGMTCGSTPVPGTCLQACGCQ